MPRRRTIFGPRGPRITGTDPDLVYSVQAAAEFCCVTPTTIYNWMNKGLLIPKGDYYRVPHKGFVFKRASLEILAHQAALSNRGNYTRRNDLLPYMMLSDDALLEMETEKRAKPRSRPRIPTPAEEQALYDWPEPFVPEPDLTPPEDLAAITLEFEEAPGVPKPGFTPSGRRIKAPR